YLADRRALAPGLLIGLFSVAGSPGASESSPFLLRPPCSHRGSPSPARLARPSSHRAGRRPPAHRQACPERACPSDRPCPVPPHWIRVKTSTYAQYTPIGPPTRQGSSHTDSASCRRSRLSSP